jgi:hypothetical protein
VLALASTKVRSGGACRIDFMLSPRPGLGRLRLDGSPRPGWPAP